MPLGEKIIRVSETCLKCKVFLYMEHFELSRAKQVKTCQKFTGEWSPEYHCSTIAAPNTITRLASGEVFASKCHPMSRFPIDMNFSRRAVYNELRIMQKASSLIESGRCPNFVRNYYSYVAPCRVETMFDKPTPEYAIYTINEYCDGGDLEHWQMTGGAHGPEEWQSMIGQFLLAYIALFGILNVVHRDMHWGNLLMQKTTPGGYWWYIIKNGAERCDFFVPNTGQQWKIWDFGQSLVVPGRTGDLQAYAIDKSRRDVENIIAGIWEFAHSSDQTPVIRGECQHSIEDLISEDFSALEILQALGWFQERPKSNCLNTHPFLIELG